MNKYIEDSFEFAVDNINKFGDTDIFPFPIENHIFYDRKIQVLELLKGMYKDFDKYVNLTPPLFENMLTSAGYTGFRWATQIDPIWNAFFLGLVLSIADNIEQDRIPRKRNLFFLTV